MSDAAGRERLDRDALLFAVRRCSRCGTTAGIVAVLAVETVAFFREVSLLEFLTGTEWTPLFADKHFGVLPLVLGTMLISAIAMAVALPTGLLSAIYLSEYAPDGVRRVVKPMLEILAGVPTVVYGYFALTLRHAAPAALAARARRLQRAQPGHRDGHHDPAAGLLAVRGRDARRAARPARGRLRARRDAHADGAAGGRAGGASRASPPPFILAVSRAIGETMIVAIAAGQQPRLHRQPARADRDDDRLHRPGQPRRHAAGHARVPHHLRGRHAALPDDARPQPGQQLAARAASARSTQ